MLKPLRLLTQRTFVSLPAQSQAIAPTQVTSDIIKLPRVKPSVDTPMYVSLEWSGPDRSDISWYSSEVEVSADGSYKTYRDFASSIILLVSRTMTVSVSEKPFKNAI